MRLFCFLLCSTYSYKHYLLKYMWIPKAGRPEMVKKRSIEGYFERKRQRKKGVVKVVWGEMFKQFFFVRSVCYVLKCLISCLLGKTHIYKQTTYNVLISHLHV